MTIDFSYTIAGMFTGLFIGLTGVGGGALMTPLLILFFGVSPTTAIATDLWFAAITKIAGASIHHRAGKVDWQVVRRLWTGSLPMALLVVLIISMGTQIGKIPWLNKAIGIVVIITALGLFVAPRLFALARTKRLDNPLKFKAFQPALTVVAGAILGILVALTSIGAGALGSVMLLYLYPLRMNPHRLVATDLVHAIPLAIVAGTGYLLAGLVDGNMLVSMLLGSVPAIITGSILAKKVSGRWIQVLLSIVLIAAGIKTLM
ncbi:MAG: sulfite exporter TauE/SafE family protein [Chlorobiaceae bacterium]|nr:sulfite exporter TauE/SafE family protein [Chlorobiaceae bacterium]